MATGYILYMLNMSRYRYLQLDHCLSSDVACLANIIQNTNGILS